MEYAHPGAPDRYTPISARLATVSARDLYAQPGALSCTVPRDTRTSAERQMSQISTLTITLAADVRRLSADVAAHATRIAELCARLDHQEATD